MSSKEIYVKGLQDAITKATKSIYELMTVVNCNSINLRQIHEDGITNFLLKKLFINSADSFYMKAETLGVNEAKTGLDIDLWIGENDNKYIRFCIQAKSFGNATSANERYKLDAEQCSKLLVHATKVNYHYFPLYFLYQHMTDKAVIKEHFPFMDDVKLEDIAVTVTSAFHVQDCIKKHRTRFMDLHSNKGNTHTGQLLEFYDNAVTLPLKSVAHLTPSSVKNYFRKQNASIIPFFFFFTPWLIDNGDDWIHSITKDEIVQNFKNPPFDQMEIKASNLIIINHNI